MTSNSHSSTKDQREEKHNFLLDISEKEKQLVMLIHTKGLLNTDVRELYRKVRSGYEKIITYDNEQSEVQDLEYCLWKLHYKHIDEFRKRIKCSMSGTKLAEQRNAKQIVEGFKQFLSEATEFYQSLIAKIRKYYRLPDESSFYRRGDIASFPEPKTIKQCHFLCHRFLVCLGDLARYREQYEKPDAKNHNWSMAATYYMEATSIWPDRGNPQNQLAVLATYIGDEFLALYHCIRSLAVKEPFPDARDNLIVLLERNRSSFPQPHSPEARFNFLKPSERCIAKTSSKSSDSFTCSVETDAWSLFIRLISFFFIKSSADDFTSAFSSIMRELDALMALDDTALKSSLESYQQMDSVKTGPFRALQVVSVLLFTLQNSITSSQKVKDSEDTNGRVLTVLRQWAIPATFIIMGRFADRCLEAGELNSCPLLPAMLVFVEWLSNRINEIDKYYVDEKNRIAMSYFFRSFVDLVDGLGVEKRRAGSSDGAPLWEDYELRGFIPVACTHESLDFSSRWECIDSFEKGIQCRARRIINAARIIYDKSGRKFMNHYVPEEDEQIITTDLKADAMPRYSHRSANGHSVVLEDEEVILFSPPARHNEPNPTPKLTDSDHSAFAQVDTDNIGHHTSLVFQTASPPISAGPPSLSAWVIEGDNSINPNGVVAKSQVLSPIAEAAAESLYGLSITEDDDFPITNHSSPLYEGPVPSAPPLLPDNAAWFTTSVEPNPRNATIETLSNSPPPQVQSPSSGNYAIWTGVQAPAEYTVLPQRQMTSSEWLRHYLQTHHQNLVDRTGDHQTPLLPWPWPAYYYPSTGNSSATMQVETPPPLYTVVPLDYGSELQRRGKVLYGQQQQRASYPYVCGPAGTEVMVGEMTPQPQPLLQYLKERERQLQGYDPAATLLGGHTYMGI